MAFGAGVVMVFGGETRGEMTEGAGISSTSISSSDSWCDEGTISISMLYSSANVSIFFPIPFPPVALRFIDGSS